MFRRLPAFIACIVLGTFLTATAIAQTPQQGRAAGAAGGKPMTKAEVEQMWAKGAATPFTTALKNRSLAFEPDLEWIDELTRKYPAMTTGGSAAIKGLLNDRVPPAPEIAAVEKAAPDIFTRLQKAVQTRSDSDLAPLVHPDLLANKARVYTLFDPATYRKHVLGTFADGPYRRVGVQFFQLTKEQVETLHYVQFSMSNGRIVVRDVVTGEAVAGIYLKDEQAIATNRLQLAFRALSERDDAALRSLLSPGLYEQVTDSALAFVKGMPPLPQVTMTPSTSVDRKGIRVVVGVSYLTRRNRKIDYHVDFERIDNELKVVRLRDEKGDVIAFDPNIDNYMNRRYNEPDGPVVDASQVTFTENPFFQPPDRIVDMARRAMEDRNGALLRQYADMLLDATPDTGYGMSAAAYYVLGRYDEAEADAVRALESGGTVYFPLLHHVGGFMPSISLAGGTPTDFDPVLLAVSKEKLQYIPARGQARRDAQEFPIAAITEPVQFERSRFSGQRPFISMKVKDGKKEANFNFAAFGTACPAYADPRTVRSLIQYKGTSICAAENNAAVLTLVPPTWERDLTVVLRTINTARTAKPAPNRR